MPDFSWRKPEDCPSPEYHATHTYCPNCSFVYQVEVQVSSEADATLRAKRLGCESCGFVSAIPREYGIEKPSEEEREALDLVIRLRSLADARFFQSRVNDADMFARAATEIERLLARLRVAGRDAEGANSFANLAEEFDHYAHLDRSGGPNRWVQVPEHRLHKLTAFLRDNNARPYD